MIFKASRDGWTDDDFYRCVSMKGPTLTLIKVSSFTQAYLSQCNRVHSLIIARLPAQGAVTGYISGAYVAVDWPKPPAGKPRIVVPDPSGTSFMFSLINEYNTPFRMKLADNTRALTVGGGPPSLGGKVTDAAGKAIKHCSVMMFYDGAANTSRGMACNPFGADVAYQLDESSFEGGRSPAGFELDNSTLAGSQFFAAAEIEVYLI